MLSLTSLTTTSRGQTKPTPVARSAGAIPALIVANVIWGTSFVATKPLLEVLPPATLALGRLFFALLFLLPVIGLTGRCIALGWKPAILGSTGVALTVLLQNFGLERTSATNAACISGVVPAIAVLLAFMFYRHVPSRNGVVAVGLSIAGVVAIVLFDASEGATLSPLGDLLMLASAISLAIYLVLGSRYFAHIDPIALVAGSSLYGMLLLAPFAANEATHVRVSLPDAWPIVMLAYLGAGASAFAYCFEGRALRELGCGPVAMFGNLVPAIGVAASAILLQERIGTAQVVGVVFVIAGAWLTTHRPALRPRLAAVPLRS